MAPNSQWRELEEFWRGEAEANPYEALRAFYFQHGYDSASWSMKLVNYTLGVIMARGKSNASEASGKNGNGWTQFVDIPMTGVLWKDVEHELGDADTLIGAVGALCQSGYRIGVSYNTGNDAFIASVTCRIDDHPNSGKTFTAFAETWYQALQVALYKHYFVARELWPSPDAPKKAIGFG